MPSIPTVEKFSVLLAETIAWCSKRVSASDPKTSLRTLELRPTNFEKDTDSWGNLYYEWNSDEENRAVVADVAARRAELLRADNAYTDILPPDLAGGYLLVFAPKESDASGLSEGETDGFLDVCDVPAWDTWICYVHEPAIPDPEQVRKTQERYRAQYNRDGREDFEDWQPPQSVSYILCWIPPQFAEMVGMGIDVNPMACIFWAADYNREHYNTELLKRLEAAGLFG